MENGEDTSYTLWKGIVEGGGVNGEVEGVWRRYCSEDV